jgi:hypothetical protein
MDELMMPPEDNLLLHYLMTLFQMPLCRDKFMERYYDLLLDYTMAMFKLSLQTGRSRDRFPMVSLEFFIDIILLAALWS